jgi:hypothetical protein
VETVVVVFTPPRGRGLWKMNTIFLKIQLSEAVFSRSGQRKKKLHGHGYVVGEVSNGKSSSFSSKKGLRGLENTQ